MEAPGCISIPVLEKPIYTSKDYSSDQDVRWCPGCGDFSILAQVQRSFPSLLEERKENIVFISISYCFILFLMGNNTIMFETVEGLRHTS